MHTVAYSSIQFHTVTYSYIQLHNIHTSYIQLHTVTYSYIHRKYMHIYIHIYIYTYIYIYITIVVLAGLGFSNLVQSCLHGKFKDISWDGWRIQQLVVPSNWMGGCCKDVNPNWETSNEFMAKYVSFLQNHPGLKFFFLVGCLDCPFLLYFWEDQRIRIRSPKTVPCALKFDSKNPLFRRH